MNRNKTICQIVCHAVPALQVNATVLEFNKGFDIRVMTDAHPLKPTLPGIQTKLTYSLAEKVYTGTVGGYRITTTGPSLRRDR